MIDITHDPRAAGEITRYHTWRRTRDQSVGEHSWQVMRIMLTVWPGLPRRLLVHAVWHDVGEMAGDIPWPFKARVPGLGDAMRQAELQIKANMARAWGCLPLVTLSEYEQRFFKCCENLEMWEWGLAEGNRGNRYALLVSQRMLWAVAAIYETLEPRDGHPDVRPAIRRYVDTRGRQEELNDRHATHGSSREGAGAGPERAAPQGGDVPGELEATGRSGCVHDDGAEVGPT